MSAPSKETSRIRLDELFFSRTDARGVIRGANSIFAHVSDYAMSSMLGAPHRLVRHPDMPRGVFRLMWDRLEAGQPVGAYVKNMARDQTHYWVFAVVSPIEEGFVSVRLKPSSPLFAEVEALYKRLRADEDAGKADPGTSAQNLLDALESMGFPSYTAFMSKALSEESERRATALGRRGVSGLGRLAKLAELTHSIADQVRLVDRVFRSTDQIPYNMRLQAGRMEGADGPISVISENHRQMSFAVEDELKRFQSNALSGATAIGDAAFLTAAAHLLEEMAVQFDAEPADEAVNVPVERANLTTLSGSYGRQARAGVALVIRDATKLGRQCRAMRRVIAGLEMTRIMCKIERGRVTGNTEGLDEIVSRLSDAEEKLNIALSEIETAVFNALQVAGAMSEQKDVA
ncbi:MAG: PAS domain-containing protein [Pseudomonadota bacterium]